MSTSRVYIELQRGGDSPIETFEIGGMLTLGRDPGNTVPLIDPLVSRNHAMIRLLAGGQYYFFDLGSRNGTYVNSRRVTIPVLLTDKDVITVGGAIATFHQSEVQEKNLSDDTMLAFAAGETMAHAGGAPLIQPLVIFVADIRGYTTLSENVSIQALTSMMTQWFQETQDCIESHNGTVDKFIGDCVMARWMLNPDPARAVASSLAAAWDLHLLTSNIADSFPDIGKRISIGVGINTGMAAVDIGREGTALGDTVNLAFRLETATKALNADLVLSKSTFQHLPEDLWRGRRNHITVKGKRDELEVAALKFADLPSARA